MLIQDRGDGRLRLVEQHEHGLVSGELAAEWRTPSGEDPLSEPLVLATALHDLGWRELDESPRWNPGTGLPHDFRTFPRLEKYRAAMAGIDRVAELHPYSGVLVSLHYTELGGSEAPPEFLEEEEDRRLELLEDLEEEAPPPSVIHRDLAHLQLFDRLSLFLFLASPEAAPGSVPDWLSGGRFPEVGGHGPFSARWSDPARLELAPYPFSGPELEVEVGCRDVETAPFESEEDLERAWEEADPVRWKIRIIPRAAGR